MGQFSRVASSNLNSARLDAEYYGTAYVENAKRISCFGNVSTLEEMRKQLVPIRRGIDMPNFVDDEACPLMVTIAAFEDPGINFKGLQRVSKNQHQAFKGSQIKPGDLLVAMGGYAGKAAICPPDTPESNIGRHTARIVIDEMKADVYYVWAFIRCAVGTLQFDRYITGSVQAGINLEDIRDISIATPNIAAQKYIGDKIRQAEQLRAWAKALDEKLIELEANMPLQRPSIYERKYSKAALNYLTDNRLDAKFYERKHLALESQFNDQFRKLGVITTSFKYGASVTADYVSQNDGITFIRGNAISKNNINTADIVYLHRRFLDNIAGCRVKTGDVLITRSGTVGVSCDVFDEFNGAAYGSFVIKCEPHTEQIIPAYLAWFLNSWVGQQQFRRWENGAVQLNINIEELSSIMVWLAPHELQNQIAELIVAKRESDKFARNLTIAAKSLVEALIENHLSEAELIAAEQALQTGNDQPDRQILNRLKTDGIDGQGQALFSDLDQLYSLLEQASQS